MEHNAQKESNEENLYLQFLYYLKTKFASETSFTFKELIDFECFVNIALIKIKTKKIKWLAYKILIEINFQKEEKNYKNTTKKVKFNYNYLIYKLMKHYQQKQNSINNNNNIENNNKKPSLYYVNRLRDIFIKKPRLKDSKIISYNDEWPKLNKINNQVNIFREIYCNLQKEEDCNKVKCLFEKFANSNEINNKENRMHSFKLVILTNTFRQNQNDFLLKPRLYVYDSNDNINTLKHRIKEIIKFYSKDNKLSYHFFKLESLKYDILAEALFAYKIHNKSFRLICNEIKPKEDTLLSSLVIQNNILVVEVTSNESLFINPSQYSECAYCRIELNTSAFKCIDCSYVSITYTDIN